MANRDERILIVDDEVIIRKLLHQKLSKEGFRCEESDSAIQASDNLRNNSFELVILDVRMPGKLGTDLLPEIKADYPDTMVIMATAVAEAAIRAAARGKALSSKSNFGWWWGASNPWSWFADPTKK